MQGSSLQPERNLGRRAASEACLHRPRRDRRRPPWQSPNAQEAAPGKRGSAATRTGAASASRRGACESTGPAGPETAGREGGGTPPRCLAGLRRRSHLNRQRCRVSRRSAKLHERPRALRLPAARLRSRAISVTKITPAMPPARQESDSETIGFQRCFDRNPEVSDAARWTRRVFRRMLTEVRGA